MPTWFDIPKPWLFLAPMAGVADWAFRELCYQFGADITVSHLVPVRGLIANPRRVIAEIGARHGDRPFLVQLIGHDPADFTRATRIVCDALPLSGIDINMGCPVQPVVRSGGGSALLRHPEKAAAVVSATFAAASVPVSVKLRSGWDRPTAASLAPLLEAAGAAVLTVHARTRAQQYRGEVDPSVIAAVKKAVGIPVVANGNITSVGSALSMVEATGADGLMIGRGAMGNPWLFAHLQLQLKGRRIPDLDAPLGAAIREQVRLSFLDLGPRKAPLAIRKHLIAYSYGAGDSAALRKQLETIRSDEDIERWIGTLERAGTYTESRLAV